MQLHTHLYSLSFHSEIRDYVTHGLLLCSPIVQQEPDYIRVIHPLAGVATIELIEGEPARFSHPLIGEPRRTLNDFNFPLKVQHGAFHQKPMVVLHSLRLSTLLSEAPAHFDNFEIGGHLVKAVELKSKTNIRMPLKIWKTGLEHGLGRIIRESLLEQLTGEREEREAFELNSREQEPMARPSIKSRLLSNLVA
jgi:alkyl hydroperoxide reductase subunit AhpF